MIIHDFSMFNILRVFFEVGKERKTFFFNKKINYYSKRIFNNFGFFILL